jgi:transposase
MAETRRRFDPEFRAGAVRIVQETKKPIAQVARDLGINEGTLANWVNKDIERRLPSNGGVSETEREELARLRRENAELAMERESSSARWSGGSRRRRSDGGGLHQLPEGRARCATRVDLPGAGFVRVVVLQVARPGAHPPAGPAG